MLRITPDIAVALATGAFGFLLYLWPSKAASPVYTVALAARGNEITISKTHHAAEEAGTKSKRADEILSEAELSRLTSVVSQLREEVAVIEKSRDKTTLERSQQIQASLVTLETLVKALPKEVKPEDTAAKIRIELSNLQTLLQQPK